MVVSASQSTPTLLDCLKTAASRNQHTAGDRGKRRDPNNARRNAATSFSTQYKSTSFTPSEAFLADAALVLFVAKAGEGDRTFQLVQSRIDKVIERSDVFPYDVDVIKTAFSAFFDVLDAAQGDACFDLVAQSLEVSNTNIDKFIRDTMDALGVQPNQTSAVARSTSLTTFDAPKGRGEPEPTPPASPSKSVTVTN